MEEVSERHELRELAMALRRQLRRRVRAGIRVLPKGEPAAVKPGPIARQTNLLTAMADDLVVNDSAAMRAQTLEELRDAIGDCRLCRLCAGRTHLVFGVGNPKAKLMFVGEGPGRDEDIQGEPFVGRAGQLLTDIITKGMGMKRDDVYIANVVKCRPPDNRNPEPDEVAACEPFLRKQIELIRPKVIVGLGKFAVQTLLQSKVPITKVRGNWHTYQGIKLMPTFHPAYLLRNPADKKLVWEDIKKVIKELRDENA